MLSKFAKLWLIHEAKRLSKGLSYPDGTAAVDVVAWKVESNQHRYVIKITGAGDVS